MAAVVHLMSNNVYGIADIQGLIQLQTQHLAWVANRIPGHTEMDLAALPPKHGVTRDKGPSSSGGDTLHSDPKLNQAKSRPTGGPPKTSMERGHKFQQQHRRGEKLPYQSIRRASKTTAVWTRAPEHASETQYYHGDNPETQPH